MTKSRQKSLSDPDRRHLIKHVSALFGAALFPPIVSGFLAGCSPRQGSTEGQVGNILSVQQDALIAEIAEIIIPQTDTPGAKAAGVNRFIGVILEGWFSKTEQKDFFEGMAAIEEYSFSVSGEPFLNCSKETQVAILKQLDEASHLKGEGAKVGSKAVHSFKLMKQFTLIGYYTSEIGASQELAAPTMGQYIGCESFDESGKAWAW